MFFWEVQSWHVPRARGWVWGLEPKSIFPPHACPEIRSREAYFHRQITYMTQMSWEKTLTG